MATRTLIRNYDGIYFITFTCTKWLPLFQISNGYDLVYLQFDQIVKECHFITGYVIMPNHLHLLVGFQNGGKRINQIIGNFKRFLTYDVVRRLKEENQYKLLATLGANVTNSERIKGKIHSVFKSSFYARECIGREMMYRTLDYIHANPCKGRWQLADRPSAYPHSSCSFYETGQRGVYPVTHIAELEDLIHLT